VDNSGSGGGAGGEDTTARNGSKTNGGASEKARRKPCVSKPPPIYNPFKRFEGKVVAEPFAFGVEQEEFSRIRPEGFQLGKLPH